MSENMINLAINPDMVKGVIEKQIQTAIVQNLGNAEELLENMISIALKQKVDERGKISEYSSYNKYDFMEVLIKQSVREAAQEGLKQWLKENSEKIKTLIVNELNKPERQNTLVSSYLKAIEDSMQCSWRMNCDISFKDQND